MSKPELHPWLSTPEAYTAAQKAVKIPMVLMAGKAIVVGADELLSEALTILTECALPPRERLSSVCAKCQGSLERVRVGAKFCSRNCRSAYSMSVGRGKADVQPPRTAAHIGSMWGWPEAERAKYAVREVGYCLNNYLRTRSYASETPASEMLANMHVAAEEAYLDPREEIEEYLESKGVMVDGTESFDELTEAAVNLGLISETPKALAA